MAIDDTFLGGLNKGLQPLLEEARARREAQYKSQLQWGALQRLGILPAIQALSEPRAVDASSPSNQAFANQQDIEGNLARQGGGDFQEAFRQAGNAQRVRQSQARDLLNALNAARLKTTDVGGAEFGGAYPSFQQLMATNPEAYTAFQQQLAQAQAAGKTAGSQQQALVMNPVTGRLEPSGVTTAPGATVSRGTTLGGLLSLFGGGGNQPSTQPSLGTTPSAPRQPVTASQWDAYEQARRRGLSSQSAKQAVGIR